MTSSSFNIAHLLAKHFVESKLVSLLIPAILIFGLITLFLIPREENPKIVVPAAEVVIPMVGASVDEVEHLLLTPLENHLQTMAGVKHTYGFAASGVAKIRVEFEVGEDKTESFVRLYDQVLGFRSSLPPKAGEPSIQTIDVDDVPMLVVTLASSEMDRYQLDRMAEQMVENLRSLDGVGKSEVVGGLPDELRIEIDPVKLQAHPVDINQIANRLHSINQNRLLQPQTYFEENHALRITRQTVDVSELEELVITTDEGGHPIRLGDIAAVTDAPAKHHSSLSRFHFGQSDSRYSSMSGVEMAAVHITVSKQSGVNAVPLTEALLERVETMQQSWLPQSVHLVVTRNDGEKANETVNTLIEHLFIAIAVVSIVLWFFLGWRAAAIVMLTIPLVFAIVIGLDYLAGPTLNRLTLYALILALGMLVDDAIVVIENIHRHNLLLPAGSGIQRYSRTIVEAASEIGNPTTLATAMIMVVFLSLLMVTGMLGEYFYPVAFNVPVAMAASLLVAYIVTPWAARRFLPVTTDHHGEGWLQRKYRVICSGLFQSVWLRKLFYWSIVVLLLLSLAQPAWQFVRSQGISGEVSYLGVPLTFLPKDDKNTFLVTFHRPDNTPLEETDRLVREVEYLLLENPYVRNMQTFVGIPSIADFNGQLRGSAAKVGSQYGEIRVNLKSKQERSITSIEIVQQLRSRLSPLIQNHPETTIQLVEDPPGPPVAATVLAEVYGKDHQLREAIAGQVSEAFKNTWDMAEVWATIPTPIEEFQFRVDQERVAATGLSTEQVDNALMLFYQGATVNHIHQEGDRHPTPVKLLVPEEKRLIPEQLAQAFVRNGSGEAIPLSTVVKVHKAYQERPVWHQDAERVTYVGGELSASAPVNAVLSLDQNLDQQPVADGSVLRTANLGLYPDAPSSIEGYSLHWGGELRLTLNAFRDMGIALGISMLMIFFLLVAYYQSFLLPIIAMVPIPLGMIGVFPAHWLFGHDFTAASMIGVIALSGVVVRNSLLIIDFIQDHLSKGAALEQAAIDAGALRLIPITLTTLAIAFGTLIMVPDPVFGGLALSLIFGVISSALFTVFVIPLLCLRYFRSGC